MDFHKRAEELQTTDTVYTVNDEIYCIVGSSTYQIAKWLINDA